MAFELQSATDCSFAALGFDSDFSEGFDSFSLHDELKVLIRESARAARNDILRAADEHVKIDGIPTEATSAVLTSIGRAVWYNDVELARVLLKYQRSAKDFLEIRFGVVRMLDHHKFADVIHKHRLTILSHQKTAVDQQLADSCGKQGPSTRKLRRRSHLVPQIGVAAGVLTSKN